MKVGDKVRRKPMRHWDEWGVDYGVITEFSSEYSVLVDLYTKKSKKPFKKNWGIGIDKLVLFNPPMKGHPLTDIFKDKKS